jgi:hypothetical protein
MNSFVVRIIGSALTLLLIALAVHILEQHLNQAR